MRTLVAIPVYNEIKYVADVLRRVQEYHSDILFVDDCSTDGTGDFLSAQSGIHLVRHSVNQGYGRSIIDTFDFAASHGYDWVITMDCDEQHEPEMIPTFLEAIRLNDAEGNADIISGSRYTDISVNDDIAPGDRRAINMTITAVLNELLDLNLTDSFCGFKAHRVSAMQQLNLDEAGYAFPLQLWPRAYAADLRITEIPVKRIYNDTARTFGGNLDDSKRRLTHYMQVLKRELQRIGHAQADCTDHVSLETKSADCGSVCCGCS